MTAALQRMTTVSVAEPEDVDLARLDDDGGTREEFTVEGRPQVRDDRFKTPMIPGSREPGMLTTFGVPAVVIPDSPSTMDAATIAARQREGGGAPNQRRPAREWSRWKSLKHALRLLVGVDRS